METMINLTDLLKHEILDLYSVEEQIIEALPKMVEKAKSPELKKALREHLKVTEEQKTRLDKVKQTFGEGVDQNGNKGFFSRLFGGGSGGEKCKGIEGIISEGEKIMRADITDEALDAAIIASAQKVEHYEICGYGTARAFARELKLTEVEQLLTQTLNEEYAADDLLTSLAVGKLNIDAEYADGMNSVSATNGSDKTSASKNSSGSKSNGAKQLKSASTGKSKNGSSKSAGKSGTRSGASKSNSASTNNATKAASKKAGNNSGKTNSGPGSTSSANRASSKSSSKGVSKSASKNASSKKGSKSAGSGSSKNLRATSGGQRER